MRAGYTKKSLSVIARLKQYPGIATKYDKLQANDENSVSLGCYMVWLPMVV